MDTDTSGAGADEQPPTTIYAEGPSDVAEPRVERRQFETNEAAFAAKQAESFAAQNAPNPTTDIDLAREAYGEDWNRRRGPSDAVAKTPGGEVLYRRGSTVVDSAGHVVGKITDLDAAVARKQALGTDGELGRYGVTAEAQSEEVRQANESGTSAEHSKTLDGGLGVAVDGREQAEHDRQAAGDADVRFSAPTDAGLSTDAKPAAPRKATGSAKAKN